MNLPTYVSVFEVDRLQRASSQTHNNSMKCGIVNQCPLQVSSCETSPRGFTTQLEFIGNRSILVSPFFKVQTRPRTAQ